MQNNNQFIDQIYSWLNNYSHIINDESSALLERSFDNAKSCLSAMREFSIKIFPNASKKAKEDAYWNSVEEAVNEMTIDPESFLVKFIPFYLFILRSYRLWE